MNHDTQRTNPPAKQGGAIGVVPMVFSVGLCLATIVLSAAGFGFRLMFGDPPEQVFRQAAVIVPAFVVVLPMMVWLGSIGLNKLGKAHIHPRNAWTLGWLLSTVALLSIMGVYS
ncbi:hypothetical protein SAMN02745664_11431 [Moraxella cuniculi DSM 21768]|uniref:Uncharacterized protein n=2 Tax=Moraxella cuniculi TaxID=34061 RepID=A0A1N7FLZ8_9GAMM|nr:hypothetical protein [Moraxella cuniculi]SIS01323.1 hypothetical protein SAMN02745664_11431 [Moraxella cuniculi DSM 21768]VEG13298.1 Uncharacterised protein [Moraxella cuniculi]